MRKLLLALPALAIAAGALAVGLELRSEWSEAELALVRSLSLEAQPPVPADPSNRVADDPRAAELGRAFFFDTRFSANGEVACATCHLPERQFQDDRPLARGLGRTERRTMPIAGMAHSPFLFWDGRKDSLWAQALGPLESAVEHGGDRTFYAHLIAEHWPRRRCSRAPMGRSTPARISSETPLLDDPAETDSDVGAIERLEAICHAISPALSPDRVIASQAYHRPVTRDGPPLVGPVLGTRGAVVATGHGVWGILNAPVTGEAVAEFILNGTFRTVDISPFNPGRLPPRRPGGRHPATARRPLGRHGATRERR